MKRLLAVLVLLVIALGAWSQTLHYVLASATGTGTGADWTNAYTALPASLTRGDYYYIGDGTYSNYVFDDNLSTTLYIYILKATQDSHGTSTGWLPAYGDGQAVFTSATEITWNLQRGYYYFDGMTGSGKSGYGIKVTSTQNLEGEPPIYAQDGYTVDNMVFRHLEIAGIGAGSSNAVRLLWSNSVAGRNSWLIQNNYFFGGGRAWISITGGTHTNTIIENNYFEDCGSNDGGIHCAGIIYRATVAANIIIRNNILENMMYSLGNSGYIEPQGQGGSAVYIYGNLFLGTDALEDSPSGLVLYTSTDYGSFDFYHNTVTGLNGNCGVRTNVATGTIQVLNNLWYGNTDTTPGHALVDTLTHNAYEASMGEANQQVLSSNPFRSSADFHLAYNTDAGFNVGALNDPDGTPRTTFSRGAYEYVSSGSTARTTAVGMALGLFDTVQRLFMVALNAGRDTITAVRDWVVAVPPLIFGGLVLGGAGAVVGYRQYRRNKREDKE